MEAPGDRSDPTDQPDCRVCLQCFRSAPSSDADDDHGSDTDHSVQPDLVKQEPVTSKPPLPNPLSAERLPNPLGGRLPHPSFNVPGAGGGGALDSCSVFVTSFDREAREKQSVLERHVALTDMTETERADRDSRRRKRQPQINICRAMLKKGHCRYGKECKYSHNLVAYHAQQAEKQAEYEASCSGPAVGVSASGRAVGYAPHVRRGGGGHGGGGGSGAQQQDDPEGEEGGDRRRRKRVGISNQLMPPKRAMQALSQQRARDRPWTVNQ